MRFSWLALAVLSAMMCQGRQDEARPRAHAELSVQRVDHSLDRRWHVPALQHWGTPASSGGDRRGQRGVFRARERGVRGQSSSFVGSGLTGIDDFPGFSTAIFGSDAPQFSTGFDEVREEKRTVRYDFGIPLSKSGYHLRSGVNHAVVPLPGNSPLTVSHMRSSIVTMNRIEFSGCRQYTAETRIEYGEPSAAPRRLGTPAVQAELPAGLGFGVQLEAPVGVDSSAGVMRSRQCRCVQSNSEDCRFRRRRS
jgi:hypothetical protein